MQFVHTAHSVIHLIVQHRRLKSKKDERGQLRFFLTPDLSTSQSVDFEKGIVFRVFVCLFVCFVVFAVVVLFYFVVGRGGGRFVCACVRACVRACVCVSWCFFVVFFCFCFVLVVAFFLGGGGGGLLGGRILGVGGEQDKQKQLVTVIASARYIKQVMAV